MKPVHKTTLVSIVAGIITLVVASLALAYLTPLRDPLTVTFKRIYPQAFVGYRIVSLNDVEQAILVAKKYGISEAEAERHYMEYEKSEALARSLNISAKNDAAADEFRFYTKGKEAEYRDLLRNNYGNSEYLFYKYLIYPQVTDAQLHIKYNNDIKSTNPAFKQAQSVLERIKKGEKFEDLAKSESDDQATAQIGGDLGFYESGQLLPELEDQISISALGEVRQDVITSRLGYHIVYPVEYSSVDGKKLWHAKHMLFVPEGYDSWLTQKTSTVKITSIKK